MYKPDEDKTDRRTIHRPLPRTARKPLGLGVITGAAADDPAAIGVFASAGAKIGQRQIIMQISFHNELRQNRGEAGACKPRSDYLSLG